MELREVSEIKFANVKVLYCPITDEVGFKRVQHDERPSNRIWLPRLDAIAIIKHLETEDD